MPGLLQRGFNEPSAAHGIHISLSAASGKMQHAVDAAGERLDRRARQGGGGNRAIDHRYAHREIPRAEITGDVAGAIRAGEIEKRQASFEPPGGKPREIAAVAVGGYHLGEAGRAHRLCAVLADREHRHILKLRAAWVPHDRGSRVGAGDQDRRPRPAADLGILQRLDAKERRDNNGMAAHA